MRIDELTKAATKLRVLDFDIENRPLSYWIPDRPTAEITSIAACWDDGTSEPDVRLLGVQCAHGKCRVYHYGCSGEEMLEWFTALYAEADIVTGHYITRHDLPIINGALLEYGMPMLGEKLVIDTKTQLRKKSDIPATQEHLSDMLGVEEAKYHMTQARWRLANRLTPEGVEQTRTRVVGDVKQHMALRRALTDAGWLNPPELWRP
jgi:hypothetical protein